MSVEFLFVSLVVFSVTAFISAFRRHYTEFSVLCLMAVISAFAFFYRLIGGR